jgi:phospholipase/carboxylesterase
MIHGRGGSAQDILSLASHLHVDNYALVAAQATHQTWYPYSFMAPVEQNEPWLSSAIDIVSQTVEKVQKRRHKTREYILLWFLPGACLTLEFLARNAQRFGAAIIGGVIGDKINEIIIKRF